MFAEHPSKIDIFNQAADFLKAMSSLLPPEKMFWHVFQCALSVSVSIQVYQKCLFAVLQQNIFTLLAFNIYTIQFLLYTVTYHVF